MEKDKKYKYSFFDGIIKKDGVLGIGLKEPKVADKYAIRLLSIVEDILRENYEIKNCKACFSDDDYGSYGEMILIENGNKIISDIERWKNYYLNGDGKKKREIHKDLIYNCTLYMDLLHLKGRPYLNVKHNMVISETDKKKQSKRKFKLKPSLTATFDKKTGKLVNCSYQVWTNQKRD